MAYCTVEDVRSATNNWTDGLESLVSRLIERATVIIDAELHRARIDEASADPALLRECCCTMVEDVLEVGVGSDYGDAVTYDAAGNKNMSVPAIYRRLLGIPWRRGGMSCVPMGEL